MDTFQILFMGLNVLMLVLVAVAVYSLLMSISLRDSAKERIDKVYTQLASKDKQRIDDLERERLIHGRTGKEAGFWGGILEKIDNLLVYSETSIKHTWINTSTYIVLSLSGFCVVFMAVLVLFSNLVLSALSGVFVVALPLMVMSGKANENYKKVKKELLLFVNNVGSMGSVHTSLVSLLNDVSDMLAAPLSTAIDRAVVAVNLEGDEAACPRLLCREIEHPYFVRFIRHLEISTKNDSDFSKVARDYASQLDLYLRSAEKQRAIFSNGRGTILTLIFLSMVMNFMMVGYVETGVWGMLVSMSQDFFGAIILIVTGAVYIVAILYMLFGMGRD